MLTNEEQRVAVYTADGTPTLPATVRPDTPLDAINLNWTERDLPERERTKHVHRLHPYLGKYIPQLVEIFVRKYFRAGQTILDPFCGSGTRLVQANELGINTIGCDISAFNVLLCQVKTAHYDLARLRADVLDIIEKVQSVPVAQQATLWDAPAPFVETDNPYLHQWYAPRARTELLTYAHLIETGAYLYKDVLRIILSRAARSARLTTHFDLDFPKQPQTEPYHCYKHARVCSPTTDTLKFLKRYSLDTLARITEYAHLKTEAHIRTYHSDSRHITYPPLDGVITSPPYVGLIDYHAQHAYAYNLLNLSDQHSAEIGAAANGASQRAQQTYIADIVAVFRQAYAALIPGGRMVVVAADKANLYPTIAQQVGVEVEAVLQRHVNRRTGRRSGEFYESVFIWRKR